MVDEPNTGARIPITLLTGFLGSGKTTVLNHLLKQPELGNAAVLINEFGEIGLDHDLVEAVTENLVLLQNGCLCCTIRGDLIQTLDELYEERERGDVIAFDRLVIETTGLADPAPIIHTLLADRPEFRSAKAPRNRCARLTATPASLARWSETIDNELVRKDFAKAAEWIKRGGVELT